jgi:hypothetical protein
MHYGWTGTRVLLNRLLWHLDWRIHIWFQSLILLVVAGF